MLLVHLVSGKQSKTSIILSGISHDAAILKLDSRYANRSGRGGL